MVWNPLKSLVMGPSLSVNCYLENKCSFTSNPVNSLKLHPENNGPLLLKVAKNVSETFSPQYPRNLYEKIELWTKISCGVSSLKTFTWVN